MPERTDSTFKAALLTEKVQFFFTDLNDLCMLPTSKHASSGSVRRRPKGEAQVRVVREKSTIALGISKCGQGCTAARFVNERDGTVMKDTSVGSIGRIDILGTPEHIGARMTVEHEVTFALCEQGDKREGSACLC